jgi:hypothetical protein
MSGWNDRLGPLNERSFRLLLFGQAASYIGDGMVPVAISFAVLDLTGSVADIGFVFAARLVPLACFLLIGGVTADRFPRRTVMIVADAVRFVGQGVLAMLLLSGGARMWHVLVLQAVHGTASAFFMPAVTGLVPQTVGAERLQQANALRWAAFSSGNVLGPAVAGVLVASIGAGAAIGIDAATFALSAGFLVALRLQAQSGAERHSVLGELAAGWREFASRRWLIAANVVAALGNALVIAPFLVAGPAIAKRFLGGAEAWALIAAAFGGGSIVGGIVAMRVRTRRPMLVGLALVALHALPTALLALRAPAAIVAVGALAAGAQLTLLNTLWETTLQGLIPSHLLSRIAAYDWVSSTVVAPAGFVVAGLLAGSILGVSGTLWLASAVALSLAAVTPLIRSVRTLELPDPAANRTVTEG